MIFSFVTKEPKISFLSLSSSSSFISLINTIEKKLFTAVIARRRGDLGSHRVYGRATSLTLINKVKKKCCECAAKPMEAISYFYANMNLAISNVLTWKISKITSLENKGAEWAR